MSQNARTTLLHKRHEDPNPPFDDPAGAKRYLTKLWGADGLRRVAQRFNPWASGGDRR